MATRPARVRKPTRPDPMRSYHALVRRFPLVRLRDDDHLGEAVEVIDHLLRRDLDDGERTYLDVLTDLVESYESEHHPMPDASEADVVRLLMESNGIGQSELARQVGIAQSTISAVLNGRRRLTRDQIDRLSRRFGVSPIAFMPAR